MVSANRHLILPCGVDLALYSWTLEVIVSFTDQFLIIIDALLLQEDIHSLVTRLADELLI